MEGETDILHLLTNHQVLLFVFGALGVVGILLLGVFYLGKRSERRKRGKDNGNE